jgi:hypothetical protein
MIKPRIVTMRGLLWRQLSFQTRRQRAVEHNLEDSLMPVVSSIIVLAITALLVFWQELTARPAAPRSKPTTGAKRR